MIIVAASEYAFTLFLLPMFKRAEMKAPGLTFEWCPLIRLITEELYRGVVGMVISRASGTSPRHKKSIGLRDAFSF
jgi:hypothetical protein